MWIDVILLWVVFSFLGWVVETIFCSIEVKRFVERGFLIGPFCPIYGFGALLIIYPLHLINGNLFVTFILSVLIVSILEYITGWIMEKLFKTKWWDYSDKRFQIHGRICLSNSLLFGLLCIFVYYDIQPSLSSFLLPISYEFKLGFLAAFSMYFIVDLILSIYSALKLSNKLKFLDKLKLDILEKYTDLEEKVKEEMIKRDMDEILGNMKEKIAYFEKRLIRSFPNLKTKKDPTTLNLLKSFFIKSNKEKLSK